MSYYSEFLPYTFLSVACVGIYFLLEDKLSKPWMRWLWWFVTVLVVIIVSWRVGARLAWPDFGNGYYYGGRMILKHPGRLYNEGSYVNFPVLAYLFVPFGVMSKEEAGRIFFVINIVSILPLAFWLVKFCDLKSWRRWLVLFLLLINGPLDYSIWLGNSTHIIMLSMIIALWCFQSQRQWATGILLGVNGLIKIPMIMPAGYFLVSRKWKVVGGGLLVLSLIVLLSLKLTTFDLNREWLESRILSFAGNPVAAFNNQSVYGVFARELIPDIQIKYWQPIDSTLQFSIVLKMATALLYLSTAAILMYRWKHPRSNSGYFLEFFIVLVCSLMTSPISWTHYFVLLLVPAAFYLQSDVFISKPAFPNALLAVALVLISIPVNISLLLFEKSANYIVLSSQFLGSVIFFIFLIQVWFLRRDNFILN